MEDIQNLYKEPEYTQRVWVSIVFGHQAILERLVFSETRNETLSKIAGAGES